MMDRNPPAMLARPLTPIHAPMPFGDEDIDWAAFPTLVLVEGPAGLLKSHFLDELVGALNERLNVLRCAHGAGGDGRVLTRFVLKYTLTAQPEPSGAHEL